MATPNYKYHRQVLTCLCTQFLLIDKQTNSSDRTTVADVIFEYMTKNNISKEDQLYILLEIGHIAETIKQANHYIDKWHLV